MRGQPVHGRARINVGDSLRIGGYVISIAATPLVSLWARALLAEKGADAPSAAIRMPRQSHSGLRHLPNACLKYCDAASRRSPPTAGAAAPPRSASSPLLRLAWQSEDLDQSFNERAVEAVLLAQEE